MTEETGVTIFGITNDEPYNDQNANGIILIKVINNWVCKSKIINKSIRMHHIF